jgi:hypothetical protein
MEVSALGMPTKREEMIMSTSDTLALTPHRAKRFNRDPAPHGQHESVLLAVTVGPTPRVGSRSSPVKRQMRDPHNDRHIGCSGSTSESERLRADFTLRVRGLGTLTNRIRRSGASSDRSIDRSY